MSIEKSKIDNIDSYYYEYTPVCDVCGNELCSESDFYAAVNAKKESGWRSRKVGGEWADTCEDCQNYEGRDFTNE
jgi:hypothetical protein